MPIDFAKLDRIEGQYETLRAARDSLSTRRLERLQSAKGKLIEATSRGHAETRGLTAEQLFEMGEMQCESWGVPFSLILSAIRDIRMAGELQAQIERKEANLRSANTLVDALRRYAGGFMNGHKQAGQVLHRGL